MIMHFYLAIVAIVLIGKYNEWSGTSLLIHLNVSIRVIMRRAVDL